MGLELFVGISALGGAVYLLSPGLTLRGPMRRIPWSSPLLGGVALGLAITVLAVRTRGSGPPERW